MKKTTKKSTKKDPMIGEFCIIANKSYGLYAGVIESITPDAEGASTVVATDVRHIAYWYGKTGGITSLAAHGLCGPRAGESRIGAPVVRARLSAVVNVFAMSEQARASIESAVQS